MKSYDFFRGAAAAAIILLVIFTIYLLLDRQTTLPTADYDNFTKLEEQLKELGDDTPMRAVEFFKRAFHSDKVTNVKLILPLENKDLVMSPETFLSKETFYRGRELTLIDYTTKDGFLGEMTIHRMPNLEEISQQLHAINRKDLTKEEKEVILGKLSNVIDFDGKVYLQNGTVETSMEDYLDSLLKGENDETSIYDFESVFNLKYIGIHAKSPDGAKYPNGASELEATLAELGDKVQTQPVNQVTSEDDKQKIADLIDAPEPVTTTPPIVTPTREPERPTQEDNFKEELMDLLSDKFNTIRLRGNSPSDEMNLAAKEAIAFITSKINSMDELDLRINIETKDGKVVPLSRGQIQNLSSYFDRLHGIKMTKESKLNFHIAVSNIALDRNLKISSIELVETNNT